MPSRPASQFVFIVGVAGLVLLAGCRGAAPSESPTTEPTATQAAGTQPVATTILTSGPTANGTVKIHYINVGQSVSTLIVSPSGETMLVDTGHYRDDGEYVLQYLQAHGIDRIDYLVVSHNDADHIGGGTPRSSTTTNPLLTASVPSTILESPPAPKRMPNTLVRLRNTT